LFGDGAEQLVGLAAVVEHYWRLARGYDLSPRSSQDREQRVGPARNYQTHAVMESVPPRGSGWVPNARSNSRP
jgi:hypothetical protein